MKYFVSKPYLKSTEKKYLLDAFNSGWISSKGKYLELFENEFSKYLDVSHSIACFNGTVALHLCLKALDIGPGDEVILPALTYISTANVVEYVGAKPVFADIEEDTWNIDPNSVVKLITKKTKAIIVVHLYGHPVNMEPFIKFGKKYRIKIIEDAAEAHGAEFQGRKVGSIGDIAAFSFFGNKIITTGEGGMVTTNNKDLAEKVRLLRGQGMSPQKRYYFPVIGFNYRMTNLQAAIGYAQLKKINKLVEKRRKIASWYLEFLKDYGELIQFPVEKNYAKNVYWLFSIVFKDKVKKTRDKIIESLEKKGVETRPFFYPIYDMPPYKKYVNKALPVTEKIALRGINLPTYFDLRKDDVREICDSLIKSII